MSQRIGWSKRLTGLGLVVLGGAALMTGTTAQAFGKPRPPVTIETVLGQLKVKLIGQAVVQYVVIGRDHRGAEADTPQTQATVYTDLTWADRCVIKVKATNSIQDTVDEGWHETRTSEQSVDLHAYTPPKAISYAEYLTRKETPDAKGQPEIRYHTDPRAVVAISVGDAVLIAKDHGVAAGIIHDLNKAGAMCAAEAKAEAKTEG